MLEIQHSDAGTAPTELTGVGEGRRRAIIDAVTPLVDGGRFPLKRIAGERVRIEAHCFSDGHDRLRVALRWAAIDDPDPYETEMTAEPNDVWRAEFTPRVPGRYRYEIVAWVDKIESWRHELERREEREDIRIALLVGAELIRQAADRAAHGDCASPTDAALLDDWAAELCAAAADAESQAGAMKALALDGGHAATAGRHADRRLAARAAFELVADRKRAEFSTWYELFPRSAGSEAGKHGTFGDVAKKLQYLADMGFDVLYLPPIHPIGRINRKGVNNTLGASPSDVGSPWAIGAAEGGHKAILPALGTPEDFRLLVAEAARVGIEIALDLAFQCAPDHPYVAAHPSWFKHRPDGSVQYAENPPKKYQDIYPFDFESEDWRALWSELKSVVEHWISQGVEIFRVDNPHTKSFAFWEWLIAEVKHSHPRVIFLAEAFTRPKPMLRLGKLGFTQSYTYFTWRNSKHELTSYFQELSRGASHEYYRPNVWPNTPDILPEALQAGLRPVFAARLVLAATLASSYGIYGPTYELMESTPRAAGSEEYLDSEKYQLRHWNLARADSLWSLIARVNRIRRENRALQSDGSLRFCRIDNEQLIAYLKLDVPSGNAILTVVNLDPHRPQSGWLEIDPADWPVDAEQAYQVHDLLSDQRYIWRGTRNYVLLDPARLPAHILKLRRRERSERDFDYYS